MNIVIVTDAWEPQVNGVVRTLKKTAEHLSQFGHDVHMLTPLDHITVPCPSYPSIRLALFPSFKVTKQLNELRPDAVHIATEGPIGSAARRWCLKHDVRFTTSYHTQFPEYLKLRLPLPLSWSYRWLRRFHDNAVHTLVPTPSQKSRLEQWGFSHVRVWGRGVDTTQFTPNNPQITDLPRPIHVNMGRVAVEKNIEAFLDLDLPGSQVVIGDGPDLDMLKRRYPRVTFTGAKYGKELASWLACADVFVFPSKTDTFGLVILEAMACGLPVAAYPVTGPKDIIEEGITGSLNNDLSIAIANALTVDPQNCIDYAQNHNWEQCSRVFEHHMYRNHIYTLQNSVVHPTFWSL
jgi:glycosyltransferase involved in cell wall biosynthesis